ncbi:unnamed protein product [Sphenostylis stenocarpa]|uniref:Uncharacterized protein n=1 Tax=Sphenostylis stenocarpa TaxID=92480 RepID=A0AA86S742_9FABA|nr:unnamed protein product [Sphenostylis stenocarpa]
MGLTNLVLTVAGVSAVVLLLRSDVKQSASIFRSNMKQIRNWLEEETAAFSKFSVLVGWGTWGVLYDRLLLRKRKSQR